MDKIIIIIIILFLIGIIAICFAIYGWCLLKRTKIIEINTEREQYARLLEQNIQNLQEKELKYRSEQEVKFNKIKENLEQQTNIFKENLLYASENYLKSIEEQYDKTELEYELQIKTIEQQKMKFLQELENLQNSLTAGKQAQLRELEKEQNIEFYTLQVDDKDLRDIKIIKSIENMISDPRPLRMLIWSSYYSKKANELCGRILNKPKVSGIYKITNLNNNLMYIGQSTDVKNRLREHMKCGLGIDAPKNNSLYKAMLKDGLESFSFELLEECDPKELDGKEQFFISLYDTKQYGYNSINAPNKKG